MSGVARGSGVARPFGTLRVAPSSAGGRAFQSSVLLRGAAIAIAVAGLVDPAITMSGAARVRLAVVIERPSPSADRVRARLVQRLGASYEIVPAITSDAAAAIVIGDRYPREPVPETLAVATVTIAAAGSPNVRIVRIDAPAEAPSGTAIRIGIDVEGIGVAGRTSDVDVRIAGLEVGRASHRWTAQREMWRAAIDAVPVGEPPFVLRVEAVTPVVSGFPPPLQPSSTELRRGPAEARSAKAGSRTAAPVVSGFSRTAADTVVDVRRDPFRVQVYEPRPSWATTFVRRALEADARFQVAGLSVSSRGISARTRDDVPLTDPGLDDVDVVIVGGLDRLSAADVRSLDRYLRERGGAVVLLPDQRIDAGPARDLVSGSVRLQPDLIERLLEQPAKLAVTPPAASLQASELLVLRALTPGTDVIARIPGSDPSTLRQAQGRPEPSRGTRASGSPRAESRGDGEPVVVSMPRGEGRLLVSGAMDAWRFRADDNGAFDRFWQSTIAGLALAVPPPIAVSVEPALLRPGGQGDVTVRVRSNGEAPVGATLDGDQPIRLSPAPEAGVFRGTFVARSTPGRSRVTVEAGGTQPRSVSRALLVQSDVRQLNAEPVAALSMLASSHRGIDVTPDHVADLERFVRGAVPTPVTLVVRHPMRSVWWIVPFAACLSVEWWLRRRQGLR